MHNSHIVYLLLLLAVSTNQLLADNVEQQLPAAISNPTPISSETLNASFNSTVTNLLAASTSEVPATTTSTTTPISTTLAPSTSLNNQTDAPLPAAAPFVNPANEVTPLPLNSGENLATASTPSSITIPSIASNISANTSEISKPKQEPLLVGVKTIIDLSHPLNNDTLYWPTNYGFSYINIVDGERVNANNETYYLKSDGFSMAIHTGTHLDAPKHFAKNGWTVDEIPLERLIDVPVLVIDLSDVVRANRSYEFTRNDFMDPKTNETLVKANSVVLVYTGISKFYSEGKKAYFGTDSKNISEMQIPGFSGDVAKFLVEKGVYGVGLDAPSADSSLRHLSDGSYDLTAHTIFTSNNIYILENINSRLSELVNKHELVSLTIAPLAISGGSGSPVRLIAVTQHSDCPMAVNSAPSSLPAIMSSTAIVTILVSVYTIVAFLSTHHI